MKPTDDLATIAAPEEFEGTLSKEALDQLEQNKKMSWDNEPEKKDVPEEKDEKDDDENDSDDNKNDSDDSDNSAVASTDDESKKAEEAKDAELELVKKIMDEEALDEGRAKEILAKDKTIVERHGGDPIKIARALRKENQAYSLAQNKIKELEEFKANTERQRLEATEAQLEANLEKQRDDIIDKYVRLHPDQADLNEDVIFERAKFEIKKVIEKQKDSQQAEMSKQAEARKEELILSIPEEFSDVAPQVKKVIRDLDAQAVLSDSFKTIDSILYWARGKKYSPEYVKSLEDAAYKRGLEQPSIKQKKTVSSDSRAGGGKASVSVSREDRDRALEMFGRREGWTEDRMIEEYVTNHKGKDFWD